MCLKTAGWEVNNPDPDPTPGSEVNLSIMFALAVLSVYLNLILLNPDMPCLCSVDPDQLASSEANWSVSALFDIIYEFVSTTWIK